MRSRPAPAPPLPWRSAPGARATLLAFAVLAFTTSAAGSDPREESRAAFLRGVAEAHREHFIAARDAFLEAYRLFPHPSILLNLAVARMHTGEYALAEESLSRFLLDDGGATSDDLANARATLEVVRRHLGTLHVRASPDGARGTLDGTPLPLTPGAFIDVRAAVGPAELRIEADGYVTLVQPVTVEHGDNPALDLQLTRSPTTATAGRVAPRGEHDLAGWTLVGGAAALAIAGTVAGVTAIGLAHDYDTRGSSGYQSPSTRSEGIAWRTSADVLFVTSLAAAGTGAFVLLQPRLGRHAQAFLGPGSCRLRVVF